MAPSGGPTDPRHDLHLVDALEEAEALEPAEHAARADEAPALASEPTQVALSSSLSWLLLGAVLLFAWLWLTQVEKVNDLAGELAAVHSELASATSDIAAWEAHDASVRGGVEGIAAQLGALQELLLAAPTSGTGFAPVANSEPGIAQEAAPAD